MFPSDFLYTLYTEEYAPEPKLHTIYTQFTQNFKILEFTFHTINIYIFQIII